MNSENEISQTVAVLFGGRSSEHEISLRSAVFILKNMPEKYRMIPVGISREGEFFSLEGTFSAQDFKEFTPADLGRLCAGTAPDALPKAIVAPSIIHPLRRDVLRKMNDSNFRLLSLEAGVFFPVLHGPNGEDGRLQGLFELAELAYVGCDIRASVIGIDKHIQKIIARDAGIPVARFEAVAFDEWKDNSKVVLDRIGKNLGFPCFVKPNALGSAVGVNRAANALELKNFINTALKFDEKVLVEEPMVGTEVECAFLGTSSSPRVTTAGEIAPKDFYDYEAKYLNVDGAALFIPARLDDDRMEELKNHARTIARVLGLDGLSRIDFWNSNGRFVFNEVNTLPGLTSISMFPKLWEHEGVKGGQWIEELIVRAYERQKHRDEIQFGVKAE